MSVVLGVGPAHCFSHEVVAFQAEKSSVWEGVCVGQGSPLSARPSAVEQAVVPDCALDGARLFAGGFVETSPFLFILWSVEGKHLVL